MLALILLGCAEPLPLPIEPEVAEVADGVPDLDLEVQADFAVVNDHPLCQAYTRAARPMPPVGPWSGEAETCDAGELPDAVRSRGLPLLDFVRSLAELSPVKTGPAQRAQECALVMHANGAISHYPGQDWSCVTEDRAATAATSLLANVPAEQSVKGFLVDPGNDGTLGHRRWLLSNWVESLGLGATDLYTCLELTEFSYTEAGPEWTSWPPAGEVPRELLESHGFETDVVGWSLQSDVIDLSGARIRVRSNGIAHPVPVTQLTAGLGSLWGVSFPIDHIPVSNSYTVEVFGVDEPFSYTVDLLDCGG
jgi:hypothetical protein